MYLLGYRVADYLPCSVVVPVTIRRTNHLEKVATIPKMKAKFWKKVRAADGWSVKKRYPHYTKAIMLRYLYYIFLVVAGWATRCAGNWLRPFGHGHGGGCRGCMERSAVFRAQELQITGRENTISFRKSYPIRASEYSQISSVLDRYT